ncbi:restriction endonuclease subunit S [Streptomyces sp. NPDC098789]|uniref:restriction endonuclease subunit S n=1 Tax=Streptomyces sp. NPDC098789 TaxID=3366098 RepID=UPI0038288297
MRIESTPLVPLSSLLKRVEAGWSPTCEPQAPGSAEWGVLSLGAITSGKFKPDNAKRLPEGAAPRTHLEIAPKDVLIARANGSRALVGVGCVVPDTRQKLLLPDLIYRLLPDPLKIDPEFLGVLISSRRFRQQVEASMRSTSGQFKISQADLRAFLVPEKSLPQQRRIIEVLDIVSAAESCIELTISKLKAVRRGVLLNSMALDRSSCPRKGWERISLKEVVPTTDYGISYALIGEPGGVPVLRMNNIRDARIEVGDLRYSPISVPDRLELRHGDVLFNRTNSIDHVGKTAMWRGELPRATFASYLVRLNPDLRRVMPEYLVEWFQHPLVRQRVKAISTVAVQQVNVNPTKLRELEIDLPIALEDQRRIVASLVACDDRIRQEEEELVKLRQMKLGLADDLLAGAGTQSQRG